MPKCYSTASSQPPHADMKPSLMLCKTTGFHQFQYYSERIATGLAAMRRRGPALELNPTLLEGGARDLVEEFGDQQGLGRAEAAAELKKAGQRWKASEKALRAELAADPAADPEAAASTQRPDEKPKDSESDSATWAEWLGGLLCCCLQREGH